MINIGNLLDACGISYTEWQLVKLDKLVNKFLKHLSTKTLQQFVSNETTKHDSIPYSRTKDLAGKIEISPSQHFIQEFDIEPEPCYNNTIMEEIPKETETEIKEEFPEDPFASIETINNSKDISDMVHEENVESNNSSVPIIEKTSNFKCKFCNEKLISKKKLNWHISQVHSSYPPIMEGMPEENENEIREEFSNDPFASFETFNNFNRFCLRCDQKFSSKQDLDQHINNVHDGKEILKLFEDLPDHQIELQTPNQINTEVFDPSFSQTYNQIQYERSTYHNDQEDIICNEDETNHETETSQLNDNRVAYKDGRFLCSICNQTFSSKSNKKRNFERVDLLR